MVTPMNSNMSNLSSYLFKFVSENCQECNKLSHPYYLSCRLSFFYLIHSKFKYKIGHLKYI